MSGGAPHDELEGDELHVPGFYIQPTDPGAVGAGNVWIDSSAIPWVFYVRNELDTDWEEIGALPPAGTIDYDYVSAQDPSTDVTGAELEELSDGSETSLHSHALGAIDHLTDISNVGVNTHTQVDSHIADPDIHFEEGDISHLNIQDIGANSHASIDSHISSTLNPHAVTATQVGKDTAQWNADELQDFPISAVDPTEGQFLRLESGVWVPYNLIIGSEYSCKAYLTANQTVTKLIWTALSWGATSWDTQNYWVIGSPTRFTIPTGQSGRYAFRANCIWDTITEDSSSQARLYKNGVAVPASHSGQYINKAAGGATWLPTANLLVYDLLLAAGDYIELYVWVSVSVALAIDALGNASELYASWMSIERIE